MDICIQEFSLYICLYFYKTAGSGVKILEASPLKFIPDKFKGHDIRLQVLQINFFNIVVHYFLGIEN